MSGPRLKALGRRNGFMSRWRIVVLLVFVLTLAAKLMSLAHPVPLLKTPDSVVGLPVVFVMLAAVLLEAAICISIFLFDEDKMIAYEVIFFSLLVLGYRVLAAMGGLTHCPCLGNIADWWPWLGRHEQPVMMALAVWLLATSCLQLRFKEGVV